ncbi:MAG TPA: TetR/AcrR family transcriptional regulator [Candidatus Limnocylindrales bacterium]|nr:TetR/AcrR family transcriptional regulator [Candidatus Limnocylindrales bacterium]
MGAGGRAKLNGSTRERILFEASFLFARRGFHATTTREIAEAVGIRQPSLFHHFESKGSIAEALLQWDLGHILPYAQALASKEGSAAVRLYSYLIHDLKHLTLAPYNLNGIYAEDVMGDPAFSRWAKRRVELHSVVERIVRQGMEAGELVNMRPDVVREAIAGIVTQTLRLYSGRRQTADLGDQIAGLVLRGLLPDPSKLDAVRHAAYASLDQAVSPVR